MKTRLWLALLASIFTLTLIGHAADAANKSKEKKDKTPAQVALEPYYKARAETTKNPGEANFEKMINAAITWLAQYAGDDAADELVADLGNFGFSALKSGPLRTAYTSRLKFQIIDLKFKPDATPDAKISVAAVEAAVADAQFRDNPNGANMAELREKLDALESIPNAGRYLVTAEIKFVDILNKTKSAAAGEKYLKKLCDSSDKMVAEMAQRELSLSEMRHQPLDLKFTALDGKEVDVAQYRGKVLAVAFWSASNESSHKELEALRELHSDLKKKGFEVVTVSYDKTDDKPKLEKAVKDLKLAWPVCFEGNGDENLLGKKLSIHRVPAIAVFDQKGQLVASSLRGKSVGTEVRKLLGVEEPPADWGSTPKRKK